jgi:putative PIN family toxin of toxin-antitoxin system
VTTEARFVLDTNVIVSALLLPRSVPRQAFDLAFVHGTVLVSVATIDELDDILRRGKFDRYVLEDERLRFLSAFIRDTMLVDVTVAVAECRDAKDNKFLEFAVSGNATCIVSGDNDLLELCPFRGIPIVTPQDFVSGP